jgi:ACT domain-containing protein
MINFHRKRDTLKLQHSLAEFAEANAKLLAIRQSMAINGNQWQSLSLVLRE